MTLQHLFRSFSTGATWNAIFFVFYKLSITLLTFVLFYTLTTTDFSTWANTNSIIFLLVLWLDFGLRKSIPRYAPLFAQQKRTQHLFIVGLVIFQIGLLTCALPLFLFGAQYLAGLLQLPIPASLLPLAALIFFTEGCVALLRLIFHAHFWIKQFNQLAMLTTGAELFANVYCAWILRLPSHELVHILFITKSIASISLILLSVRLLKKLSAHTQHPCDTAAAACAQRPPVSQFITHSLVMGTYTNIKSLSERNFLLPFFTCTLGAAQANIFKLSNDSALLFYRTIIKTIGTTDTALLAHAQLIQQTAASASTEKKTAVNAAFAKLCCQMLWLCLPILLILMLLIPFKNRLFFDMRVVHAFFIMVFGYVFEALLSPYERLLEVHRQYFKILCAYAPYVLTLGYVFTHTQTLCLTSILLLFHSTRLLGSLVLALLAKQHYKM